MKYDVNVKLKDTQEEYNFSDVAKQANGSAWLKSGNTVILATVVIDETELIKDDFLPFPSLQEQQKIASFLDTKTQQLDKVIKHKEQLINLLKERRQIIINNAVTKGIDKTVAMKDSGSDGKNLPRAHNQGHTELYSNFGFMHVT